MTKEEKKKAKSKAYREANKDKIAARDKAYYEANKERLKVKRKAYREANKDKIKAYREANKDKIAARDKAYYEANKDKLAAQQKIYREANKDKINTYRKEYYEANKEAEKEKVKKYQKSNRDRINSRERVRRATDPLYKLQKNIRCRTYIAFNSSGFDKSNTTREMLGCTYEFLRDHLAAQFTEGMTLENYGEWHIDHIIPLASAKTEKELLALAHYTNLQPLWADDNLIKGSKIL